MKGTKTKIRQLAIIITILFLLSVIIGCSENGEVGKSSGGWKFLKWGMDTSEVKQLLKSNGYENSLNEDIDDIYTVRFIFEKKGDKYNWINIGNNPNSWIVTYVVPEGLSKYSIKRNKNKDVNYGIKDEFVLYRNKLFAVLTTIGSGSGYGVSLDLNECSSIHNGLKEKYGLKEYGSSYHKKSKDTTINTWSGLGCVCVIVHYMDTNTCELLIETSKKYFQEKAKKESEKAKDSF